MSTLFLDAIKMFFSPIGFFINLFKKNKNELNITENKNIPLTNNLKDLISNEESLNFEEDLFLEDELGLELELEESQNFEEDLFLEDELEEFLDLAISELDDLGNLNEFEEDCFEDYETNQIKEKKTDSFTIKKQAILTKINQ